MSVDPTSSPQSPLPPTVAAQTTSVTGGPVTSPPPEPVPAWAPLPPLGRRILGVLVEKQKTSKTADAYPLTLNALINGCNQKSNREPILDLDEVEVEEGLATLQKKGLVIRITGGRAERFRHNLYETWTKVGPELAILAELLLRGPQTKGDLRVRAARMDPIDTLDDLETFLKPLLARRLVTFLNDPDRRGAVITHGFHTPEELVRLKAIAANTPAAIQDVDVPIARQVAPAPVPVPSPSPDAIAAMETKLASALLEIESLKARVAGLEASIVDLRKQFGLTPGTP